MIPTLALTEVTAARFLDRGRGDAAAARVAGRIVSDVRRRGEAALRAWTRRLDGAVPAGAFRVSPAEIARAARAADPGFRRQLLRAARNVRRVARRQLPAEWTVAV